MFHYGNKPTILHVHLFTHYVMLSFKSTVLLSCTAGAAALAIWWLYRNDNKDEPTDTTEIEIPKEIIEESALIEETVVVEEEAAMNEKEADLTEEDEIDITGYYGEDEVDLSESDDEDMAESDVTDLTDVTDFDMEEYEEGDIVRSMSRGQSMLSLSTSSTLCNSRNRMMGSMDLIIEESEEEESDEYEEGEILVISDSEESEGDVSEDESDGEVMIEANLNETLNVEEEPRTVSRMPFPPPPPRQMTYEEFRALAIEQEWQEALAYAMRIPEFDDI
eukprot:sb/3467986/